VYRVRRAVRLYRRSLGTHLRSVLEYEADFWLLIFAALLSQGLGLAFIGAVFSRVPALNGWRFEEVVLVYALSNLASGCGPLFFDGVWRLSWMLNKGELDYALVRPFPVVLQVSSGMIGLHGIGDVIGAVAMLAWALSRLDVHWSPVTAAVGLVLVASGIALKLAINLAANSASFWLAGPHSLFAVAVHNVTGLAQYPVSIYGVGLRVLLSGVLPVAFVSFLPAAWLLDRGGYGWLGLLAPLVAAYCVGVSLFVFRRGLRRYESTGS